MVNHIERKGRCRLAFTLPFESLSVGDTMWKALASRNGVLIHCVSSKTIRRDDDGPTSHRGIIHLMTLETLMQEEEE